MDPRSQLARTALQASDAVVGFLDTATTSMGRATHYDSAAEQGDAERTAHVALLGRSRDLYAAMLTLPGLTDRSVALGLRSLLATRSDTDSLLADEAGLIDHLADRLPVTRLLRLAASLAERGDGQGRVNNARARRLILGRLLGSPRLELWAVKYRRLMRAALTHAWGVKMSSAIRSIAARPDDRRSDRERQLLARRVLRYARGSGESAVEAVAFVLGAERAWTLPLLRAFEDARVDLEAGRSLPLEVLEGIRSTFHPQVASGDLLGLVAPASLSSGQRLAVQRRAAAAGVEVEVDFSRHDAVRLYLYAFEMGMSPELERALDDRARRAAERFPIAVGRAGILIDASASMAGSATQPLRPLATALALRDVIAAASRGAVVRVAGGAPDDRQGASDRLVRPAGATDLARPLLELLAEEPDAVFAISDGYENRAAGRFAEVLSAARRLGVTCPVYHLNPVMAARARAGVRELGASITLPVTRADGLAGSLVRAAFDTDPTWAARALVGMTTPALKEGSHENADR